MYGKRVREARNWRQMSQEQLAEALHTDRKYISRIENGRAAGSVEFLVEIASVLFVSVDYLLLGKPPTNEEAKRQVDDAIEILLKARKNL